MIYTAELFDGWERLGLFVSGGFPITKDKTKLVLEPGRLPSVQVGYVQ